MRTPRPFVVLAAASLAAAGALAAAVEPKPAPPAAPVEFNRDVRPILSAHCYACHGPDAEARQAGLRLDLREEAVRNRGGRRALAPGNPAASRLYLRVTEKDPARRMPPPRTGHVVTPAEAAILRRWIAQGAPYAAHWAFHPPVRPRLAAVRAARWVRNPIDAFILARLERAGLAPSPEADRYTLARRLALDLTGLPPSPEEVDAFVRDGAPNAYERLVDRLLASPHYGERWARVWLDLARYADSAGYGSDPLRLNIWPYRDWVIDAFNRNLPYDRFTIEQLAGDLLPGAAPHQVIATAFHRNTMTNTEGGTDDEEFRVAAVKDRIATTAQVWMGLTLGCAQCHSHKYDPITQADYYRFFAIFNQTEDADRPDEAPTLPVLTASQQAEADRLKREIALLEARMREPAPAFLGELAEWERAQVRPVEWTPVEVIEARAESGAPLTRLPDGSLLATEAGAPADTYVVRARSSLAAITALRLEALPHDGLPGGGPGHASGRFVLTDLRVAASPDTPRPVTARYVRVELAGRQRILSLAEVQVTSGGANVAPRGRARQSSTDFGGEARRAIDGNTNGDYYGANSVTHTRTEDDPWWEVDLGAELPIDVVTLWNRTDGGTGVRLSGFRVVALDAGRNPAWEMQVSAPPSPSLALSLTGERPIPLRNATASHEPPGFEAAKAIDADPRTGWAGRPPGADPGSSAAGRPQAAVFELADPAAAGQETFRVTLGQAHGARHTLGRFRLSVTRAAQPVRELPHAVRAALAVDAARRAPEQREAILAYFRPLSQTLAPLRAEVARAQEALAAIKPVDLPVLRELAPERRRENHVMVKGNFLNRGDRVSPGLPAAFHAPPAGELDRLAAARWLVSRENPLTARVAVNRFWAQLFGAGIVETEEDFGTQGALPTHPELLDWLAVEFMERGWDVKALLKTIVTSAAYRQSSAVTPLARERDPRNRLLARYPRRRLDAEGVRDQALALSGLLSRRIGGPSVYPPQPEGLWRAAFNGQRTWPTSTGEDRYRRGLYTFWRRTVPYPSMATFDAPSREICTVRRIPTNTPLQALVTLNDPAYVEMAQALGRRILREGGATAPERVRFGLRLALCRPPTEAQATALLALYEQEIAHYRADSEAARKLASSGDGVLPVGADAAEQAAWTVVANVLLNLDAVLTRG